MMLQKKVWYAVCLVQSVVYLDSHGCLYFSRDLYNGEQRLLDFITDMSEGGESTRVKKLFLPAQLLRGVLMSLVLYPVVPLLGSLSFGARFAFFFGLMF